MFNRVFAFLMVAAVAACQAPPGRTGYAVPPQRSTAQVASFTCTPGEEVPDNVPGMMRISLFAVQQSLAALSYVDNGTIVGDYAVPLLRATKSGGVQHREGHGKVEILIHYTNPQAMPHSVTYLGGKNICRGPAEVRQVETGVWEVQIPIDGGEWLNYAAILLPRSAFITPHRRAWVCVTTNFALAYLPQLTAGKYQGKPNVVCGLPGSRPGETLLAEKAEQGALWELFPLIAMK